jgi:hypothetical protein
VVLRNLTPWSLVCRLLLALESSKLSETVWLVTCIREVFGLNLDETLAILTDVLRDFRTALHTNAGIVP